MFHNSQYFLYFWSCTLVIYIQHVTGESWRLSIRQGLSIISTGCIGSQSCRGLRSALGKVYDIKHIHFLYCSKYFVFCYWHAFSKHPSPHSQHLQQFCTWTNAHVAVVKLSLTNHYKSHDIANFSSNIFNQEMTNKNY